MRMHEALLYLPHRGINPLSKIECCMSGCSTKFVVATGVAFPGCANDDQVEMYFFCSTGCYLSGLPTQAMGSA